MSSANGASGHKVSYGPLFCNRSFVALWLGQTVSFIGDYFNFLAMPILVFKLTNSPAQVGVSMISAALPMLLLGPVAGVFVDRWNRQRTMIAADVLRALLVLACLFVRTADQVWIYYAVAFLMSCVSRFFFPSQNAVLPLIVTDKNDLLAANGMMQIVQTVGLTFGPMLAGFSIARWGGNLAFVVDSISFLVSAAAIMTMKVPRITEGRASLPGGGAGRVKAVIGEIREGAAFLFGSRTLVGVLVCMSVVHLGLGAINVLWVPYLQGKFGVDARGLGIVDMAQGIGMIISGVLLGFVAARWTKTAIVGWSISFIGVSLGAMGLVPAFGYIVALSFLVGLPLIPAQSALQTMMQLAVPDLKRGRVGSAMNAITTLASLASMGGASIVGSVIGLPLTYVVAGLITMMGGVAGFFVLSEPEGPLGQGELVEVAGE